MCSAIWFACSPMCLASDNSTLIVQIHDRVAVIANQLLLIAILSLSAVPVQAEENSKVPQKEVSSYSGIGVQIRIEGAKDEVQAGKELPLISNDHPLVIFDFVPGGPAEQSGLRKGDRIIKVDGVPVAGMSMEVVAKKISGKENTAVKITVSRSGAAGKPVESTVTINRTRLGVTGKDS